MDAGLYPDPPVTPRRASALWDRASFTGGSSDLPLARQRKDPCMSAARLRRCALSFPVDFTDLEALDRLAEARGLGRAAAARVVLRAGLDASQVAAKAKADVAVEVANG